MINLFSQVLIVAISFTCCCSGLYGVESEASAAIRHTLTQYESAFNAGDAEKIGSLWSADGSFVNPETGKDVEGKEAITELYRHRFKDVERIKIEIIHHKTSLVTNDEAIEEGLIKATAPDKSLSEYAFKGYFVKEKGQWLLDGIDEIELQIPPSNFEHLQDLAWLIGEWKDADENSEIALKADWDKHKNFLTQNFTVKIYGQDQIEGRMLIAWDEANKNIRAWVFDSDGTFGEGSWRKTDKGWSVSMSYTFSNGSQGSQTNLYEQINADGYIFSAVDREVDDQILPNIAPVKVVRVK
jgi:uncharacterized protein (TIGR02246 family)